MPTLFEKLNLKSETEIVVLNAPESFDAALGALPPVTVHRTLDALPKVRFALAFITTQQARDELSLALSAKADGDALLWFAYPKKTSKRLKCEFNRDSGWEALGQAGFEPVRMVAIDDDWSALRFRRVAFIKSLTRDVSRALTQAGKERTAKG